MVDFEEHLTVRETAEILRKKPRTILQWIKEGRMFRTGEVKYVGDGYLITARAIQRIMEDGVVQLGEDREPPKGSGPGGHRVISRGI